MKQLQVELDRSKEYSDKLQLENMKLMNRNNEYMESIEQLKKEVTSKR